MGTENLDRIFNPRRIAVIGASDREDTLGARLLRNLVGVGYSGAVYPVNPFRSTVQGITAYPSIGKVPWKVDFALIATPAHTVPQIAEECGKAGVPGIAIISAGFKEAGTEGENLERQILKYKQAYGMRIIGPSSFGVMVPRRKLNATFSKKSAVPGKIALISQSAALCASGLDWASEAHMGFSAVVSTGSMLDVDFGDLIDYFGADAATKSIVLYIECLKNTRKFMSAARGFARAKPIIVVRAGRFPETAEATLSHIGALCGEDDVYDAAFKRAGMVRVEAISDLFNCAEALSMQPNPKGPNLTVITNAGGPAIMAADYLISHGGKLAKLNPETVKALKTVLPSYCSTTNPVDILEEAAPDRFQRVMEACLNDPNSDGFLIIYTPQGAAHPLAAAKVIIELAKQTKKPVLVSLMCGGACWHAKRVLQKSGIPAFDTPEQAVSVFMHMYSYTQNLELLYQTPEELTMELSIPTFYREALAKARREGQTVLDQTEVLPILDAYKIPTVKTLVAKTSEEAQTIASELGYPVVMKALSPQIIHKTRAGGVVLNVWAPAEVKTFFNELAEKTKNFDQGADFRGVAIQPMIRKRGYELLIGSRKDTDFGSVIVFGMGGVAAELSKDTKVGFPPLNQILARRLIEGTAIYERLKDSNLPLNVKVIEEILVKFSQLVIDFPEVKEMDINPLIVNETSAIAVDARVVIDPESVGREFQRHEHLVIASYPRKYVSKTTLKDGSEVVLRPIRPEDEGLLSELYGSLSQETMRFRFFHVFKDASHEILSRYCNIDYDREIAIVALKQNGQKKIIGVVLLILEPGGKRGEFAVLVGDQWQSQGLGSKLMDYVIQIGKDMSLETVYGFVISDNSKMVDLCKKKGFQMEPMDEETLKATLELC